MPQTGDRRWSASAADGERDRSRLGTHRRNAQLVDVGQAVRTGANRATLRTLPRLAVGSLLLDETSDQWRGSGAVPDTVVARTAGILSTRRPDSARLARRARQRVTFGFGRGRSARQLR